MNNFWDERVGLAREGWQTSCRISWERTGGFQVGFWAKTHYWAGWLADVNLHAVSGKLSTQDIIPEVLRLQKLVADACGRAKSEYSDAVPCSHFEKTTKDHIALCVNSRETERCLEEPKEIFPTYDIPDVESGDHKNQLLESLFEAAKLYGYVEDDLNPYAQPYRMARDCQNIRWQYLCRIAPKITATGEALTHNPQKVLSHNLYESVLCKQVSGLADGLDEVFRKHQGVPPGFTLLSEKIAQRSAALDDLGEADADLVADEEAPRP